MTDKKRTGDVEQSPPVRDIPGVDRPTGSTPDTDQPVVVLPHMTGHEK